MREVGEQEVAAVGHRGDHAELAHQTHQAVALRLDLECQRAATNEHICINNFLQYPTNNNDGCTEEHICKLLVNVLVHEHKLIANNMRTIPYRRTLLSIPIRKRVLLVHCKLQQARNHNTCNIPV